MSRKSPSRIRKDLEAARNRVNVLVGVLKQNESERRWGLGEECSKALHSLQRLLQENQAPQEYKVAVIGRFKAGKSSFVNVLLDQRLAGVDTSPETAAVTTFRAGGRVVARIKIIDRAVWEGLKTLFQTDAADAEAHRIANWFRFGREQRTSSIAEAEIFDLAHIERELVRPGGHTLTIAMSAATTREAQRRAEAEFQRRIKQYTSSTKPHHCLVESIEIETPSALLGEGVTLVDTPGLDDTERFRVQLTERAVQDVDAVLFLTKSGASYGQSEKDFVLSLLRKGTIKQLIFVVTQVDQTYEQHVRESRDQEEDPEPISVRIEAERARLRAEIEATLNELAGESSSASVNRYRDQLNSVEIAFTSAANHLDHVRKDPVRFPIAHDDPGGMRDIKDTLYRILSTESRLAAAKQVIQDGVAAILQDMLSVIDKRRAVVAGLRSREVAESKLATFRREFEQNGKRFSEVTRQDGVVLRTTLANRAENESLIAEIIALQADEVLASYETDDAARHWRTRRGGR
jgi:predicted GTPase